MIVIGITGGIGSGKTTISNILREEGYNVFDSDKKAKFLCDIDPDVMNDIRESFGKDIYKNNILDRKKLAQIVFNDKGSLDTLNSIIHPKTRELMYEFLIEQIGIDEICFVESAIMFESGLSDLMDSVLSITAPEEIRINRVIERDNTTKDKILDRIKNQINEKDRLSKSDYIISTNQPLNNIKDILLRLVKEMKKKNYEN